MNAQAFPLRWQVLLGLLGLVLICMSALGTATAVSEAPSLRPTEGTKAVAADTQHIALEKGWNLVSSRLILDDPSMEAVFAPIAEAVEVVRDESGAVYRPSDGTNTIGTWDVQEAYSVYVSSPQTLIIEGTPPTASDAEISLQDGWNTVSYLPDTTHSPTEALTSIEESLVMVKDGRGNAFVPEEGIHQLGAMTPGKGYKLYLSDPETLEYPTSSSTESFAYNPDCLNAPGSVKVEDYGTLTSGAAADSTQRAANTSAVNAAIANAPTGGAVCLPADSLYFTYDYDPGLNNDWVHGHGHITVLRDSVTVWGAGACGWGKMDGCTYLETPGDTLYYHDDLDGDGDLDFIRGFGISFAPRGYGNGDPLHDVTLKGFELNGGTGGWTGNYDYSLDQDIDVAFDGWDLEHKGITLGGGGQKDDILIEDVKVKNYRGEVIYNGGFGAGTIVLRRVWSHESNASAYNIATADSQLVEDSKFGPNVRFWGEFLAEGIPNATSVHRDNTYVGCNTRNGCLAMAVDDASNLVEGQTWTWENNTFKVASSSSKKRLFLLTAGPYDLNINGNTIEGGQMWITNGGAGSETATLDISGNTHDAMGTHPFQFQNGAFQGTISDNTFSNNGSVYRAVGGNLSGLIIENNVYEHEKGISRGGGGPDPYPLIRNNTYLNRNVPGPSTLFEDEIVEAYSERKSFQGGPDAPFNAELEANAADGQRVWLFGGKRTVVFPADASNHAWENDFSLSSSSDSMQVEFDRSSNEWFLAE